MSKVKFDDGIHAISNEQYHASEGISRSGLWTLKKSPLHYWQDYINPKREPRKATADMILGSLVHTLALEPELFADEYSVKPEMQALPPALKLKDVGRELFDKNKAEREAVSVANEMMLDQFSANSENKTVITNDVYEHACAMSKAVHFDDTAKSVLDGAKVEHSIYFTHKETGLQCKVRPDIWLGSIVADLKTTRDASFKLFQGDAYRSGYHLQAAMIYKALESIGVTLEKFLFICVEKTAPFAVATYILEDEAIDYGVQLFDDLMIKYAECLEQDRWPGYSMQTISLPGWAKFDEVI